jgi:hypothetical protein
MPKEKNTTKVTLLSCFRATQKKETNGELIPHTNDTERKEHTGKPALDTSGTDSTKQGNTPTLAEQIKLKKGTLKRTQLNEAEEAEKVSIPTSNSENSPSRFVTEDELKKARDKMRRVNSKNNLVASSENTPSELESLLSKRREWERKENNTKKKSIVSEENFIDPIQAQCAITPALHPTSSTEALLSIETDPDLYEQIIQLLERLRLFKNSGDFDADDFDALEFELTEKHCLGKLDEQDLQTLTMRLEMCQIMPNGRMLRPLSTIKEVRESTELQTLLDKLNRTMQDIQDFSTTHEGENPTNASLVCNPNPVSDEDASNATLPQKTGAFFQLGRLPESPVEPTIVGETFKYNLY